MFYKKNNPQNPAKRCCNFKKCDTAKLTHKSAFLMRNIMLITLISAIKKCIFSKYIS